MHDQKLTRPARPAAPEDRRRGGIIQSPSPRGLFTGSGWGVTF